MDDLHFFLLVLATVLVTAGGNIINDIVDVETDSVNKPDKVVINKYITKRKAFLLYWTLNVVGLLVSFYLAYYVERLPLLVLYPLAVALLWVYSHYLKKMPLSGNILIAVFCSGVTLLVYLAESENIQLLNNIVRQNVFNIIIGYAIFAFLSTLYREIIKDMEDVEGDIAQNCRTLPIVMGIYTTKIIAFVVGVSLLILLLVWGFQQPDVWKAIYLWLGLGLTLLYSFYLLIIAKGKKEFHYLGNMAKGIMLLGLIYLLII